MPNIKSAKKRVLVENKKQEENKMIKTQVKTAIKNVVALVNAGDIEGAEKALPVAYGVIDSAYLKGILKKNTAANKKSGIAKLVAKAKENK